MTKSVLDLVTKGRGRRPAEVVSVVVGVGVGLLALASGFITAAFLAAFFVVSNVTSLSKVKQVEHGRRAAVRPAGPDRAPPGRRPAWWPNGCWPRSPSGATLRWASELLGWSRLWQGDRAGAEGAVQRYAHAGPPSGSFRAAQALAEGRTAEGVAVMTWAFANEPPGPSQVLGAIAIAGTGQSDAVHPGAAPPR